MRQSELAEEIRRLGGRASRETVSHWENLDGDGQPRARMTRKNADALVALARAHGLLLTADLFVERRETPLETLARQQAEVGAKLDEIMEALKELRGEVKDLRRTQRDGAEPRQVTRRDHFEQSRVA
jgi:hypothetical protein